MDVLWTVLLIVSMGLGEVAVRLLGWDSPRDGEALEDQAARRATVLERERADPTPRTVLDKLLRRQLP